MQQSVVKFITYSHRRCSTCFGHYCAHHQELFQTAVAASGFRINAEVGVFPAVVGLLVGRYCLPTNKPTTAGGCDCSLKELLMMGIIMPETC
jgi:hypothetical protein